MNSRAFRTRLAQLYLKYLSLYKLPLVENCISPKELLRGFLAGKERMVFSTSGLHEGQERASGTGRLQQTLLTAKTVSSARV